MLSIIERKIACLFLFFYFISVNNYCQITDTFSKNLEEFTVTGYRVLPAKFASYNISTIDVQNPSNSNCYSISELLSKQSGLNMLSTGTGISKPVIRGLYGNRILVLLNGLKFDNQQWQDEHGFGLTTMGISKIELIKGPFGVLYGTEAMGGVINIIEEKEATDEHMHATGGLTFNSNTLGGTINYGVKKSNHHSWYRILVGVENNGDYSDGNHTRVSNSRFDAYHLKGSYGYNRKKWKTNCNFSSSFNRSGFIFNDLDSFLIHDNRWSRSFSNNPAHYVNLNILSSENIIETSRSSRWQINFGLQSNSRREDEGGGAISLNMHLLTVQLIARYEKEINAKNKLIISHLNNLVTNTNYGARKLIPDALLYEANFSAFLESKLSETLILENGLGLGAKTIVSKLTTTINDPGREIQPFTKFSTYYNAFSGLTFFPNLNFNLKLNLSTGVRIANLAELSSNGLHEGIYIYEIGNPEMKNEQIFSISAFCNYHYHKFSLSFSPFLNIFDHYIYLAPTDMDWFGFPIYKYLQQEAYQYGTEAKLGYSISEYLNFEFSYSGMISKTKDGNYTPFIPAQKWTPELESKFSSIKNHPLHFFLNCNFYQVQTHIYPLEKNTPSYQLINTGLNTTFFHVKQEIKLSISINNILNTSYYDHLSRLKTFGLLNMGRNIIFSVKYLY